MFLTLKEIDLSFGQEGQRPDACENGAQCGSLLILCSLGLASCNVFLALLVAGQYR
jgi:hypothetical protein